MSIWPLLLDLHKKLGLICIIICAIYNIIYRAIYAWPSHYSTVGFIVGIMSSSGLYVSCKEPLILPDANFCAKCGSPQLRPQQDHLCVQCKFQLPPNAMFCVKLVLLVKCGTFQPHSQQQGIYIFW